MSILSLSWGQTQDSLVVLDELGRGTSTFDGLAIAGATLTELVNTIGCRTLFSTHYHSIAEQFSDHDRVGARMMSFFMAPDPDDVDKQHLIFLYKVIIIL